MALQVQDHVQALVVRRDDLAHEICVDLDQLIRTRFPGCYGQLIPGTFKRSFSVWLWHLANSNEAHDIGRFRAFDVEDSPGGIRRDSCSIWRELISNGCSAKPLTGIS